MKLALSHASKMNIEICEFDQRYHHQVIALVSGIQQGEFGVKVSPDEQPDLKDIAGTFESGRGKFWCAVHDDRVVGTVGLLVPANEFGVIRKMFVAKEYRGRSMGVSQRLLDTALTHSKSLGLTRVLLGTVSILHAAMRFYERNGFSSIPIEMLPKKFPRMAVDDRFFEKLLG